jgi:hypothetical protein
MTADGGFCKGGRRLSADFRNRMKSLPIPPARQASSASIIQ